MNVPSRELNIVDQPLKTETHTDEPENKSLEESPLNPSSVVADSAVETDEWEVLPTDQQAIGGVEESTILVNAETLSEADTEASNEDWDEARGVSTVISQTDGHA